LARVEVPKSKKSELEDLNWKAYYLRGKFLKTDVAVQEVGPRYFGTWFGSVPQTGWLAGWHEWAKGRQFGLSLFSQ
jgi:hypothetical protein